MRLAVLRERIAGRPRLSPSRPVRSRAPAQLPRAVRANRPASHPIALCSPNSAVHRSALERSSGVSKMANRTQQGAVNMANRRRWMVGMAGAAAIALATCAAADERVRETRTMTEAFGEVRLVGALEIGRASCRERV